MDIKSYLGSVIRTKDNYILALDDMGLRSVEDLLLYFPRDYELLSEASALSNVRTGDKISVKGVIENILAVPIKSSKVNLTRGQFFDIYGNEAELLWFNQPFVKKTIPKNVSVTVSGKVQRKYGKISIQNPRVELIGKIQVHSSGMLPVYPQHDVITSKWLREKIKPLLFLSKELDDFLPKEIVEEEGLISKSQAVQQIHFPSSQKLLDEAKRRLEYEELFLLQLLAVQKKSEWKFSRSDNNVISPVKMDVDFVKDFFSTLPFTLTNAQKIAIYEVLSDFEKPYPMIRLLEGDVGSGKTVVAVIALVNAVLSGYQAVIMAPTEVLARQHLSSISKMVNAYADKFLKDRLINIQLLVGSMTVKEKNQVKDGIANNQVDIAIGTHALIQKTVKFDNLGFVIIDEQHRFGVKQREALMHQGSPHVLNMTATPIPRTLAMIAYGDYDLSVLNEMPPGRQTIITKVIPDEERDKINLFIEDKIKKSEQIFVVCPLIEDSDSDKNNNSDKIEVKSVKSEYEHLLKIFPNSRIDMLHGKMKADEKNSIMTKFKNGDTDILVSTSVIEVGVDIPNASVMLIEGAERFGLSQLHQFRGRVGRGDKQSYCFLCLSPKMNGSFQRLKAMVDCSDGFKLAEIDLNLRGPGEVYGIKQSGIPDLKFAKLNNGILISKIRKIAETLIKKDLELNAYPKLKLALLDLKKTMNEGS